MEFDKILFGGDLRSIGKSNSLIKKIKKQTDFDELFKYLFHKDRLVVMRTADIIEKITIHNPEYLAKHKKEIIELSTVSVNKEAKWHLALLLPRLSLDKKEFGKAWKILTIWVTDKTNSRIVRVNAVQALFELKKPGHESEINFRLILAELEKENIPSLNARIKKLKNTCP